jgi:hypothetical protein
MHEVEKSLPRLLKKSKTGDISAPNDYVAIWRGNSVWIHLPSAPVDFRQMLDLLSIGFQI